MRLLLPIVLLLAFMLVGKAQLIEVTATGTVKYVTSASPDPGVQIGDLFTETFEISSTTLGLNSAPGASQAYQGVDSDTVTAGSYTMTSANAISVATIFSDFSSYYGYQMRETFNTAVPVYADIELLSYSTPAVAPTTSLGSIKEFPVADFNLNAYMDYIDTVDELAFTADISSYTVTVIAVPEPSAWAMMLGGLGLLVFCIRRKAAKSK